MFKIICNSFKSKMNILISHENIPHYSVIASLDKTTTSFLNRSVGPTILLLETMNITRLSALALETKIGNPRYASPPQRKPTWSLQTRVIKEN